MRVYSRTILILGALLALGLIGGWLGRVAWLASHFQSEVLPVASSVRLAEASSSGATIYSNVHGSVARINTNGLPGTGVYIGNRHVLTAARVVVDFTGIPYATRGIVVLLNDGARVMPATLMAWSRDADLAILELAADPNVPRLQTARTESIRIGDPAFMIGMPVGLKGAPQLTEGTLTVLALLGTGTSVVEHDMVAEPGMIGSPIFDRTGRIVGIQEGVFTGYTDAAGLPAGLGIVPAEVVARLESSIWASQDTSGVDAMLKNIDNAKP